MIPPLHHQLCRWGQKVDLPSHLHVSSLRVASLFSAALHPNFPLLCRYYFLARLRLRFAIPAPNYLVYPDSTTGKRIFIITSYLLNPPFAARHMFFFWKTLSRIIQYDSRWLFGPTQKPHSLVVVKIKAGFARDPHHSQKHITPAAKAGAKLTKNL